LKANDKLQEYLDRSYKMGSFIPTPYDQEIVARLNWLFYHYRTVIHSHQDNSPGGGAGRPSLFPAASLSRVARRIGAYPQSTQAPSSGGGLKNPRARWLVFLDNLPNQTSTDINTVIVAALQNNAPIVFDLTHEANPPQPAPYVIMASPGQPVQATLPNGQVAYCLTLVCQAPIPEDNQAAVSGGTNNNPTSNANIQRNETPITNLPWNPDDTNY
jgi:hypothetical protein